MIAGNIALTSVHVDVYLLGIEFLLLYFVFW